MNDLPGVVAALAAEAGLSFAHATRAQANWSLEEHWNGGIRDVIAEARPDVVVLQPGPSSLPSSQEHLANWTGRLAPVIRQAGGVPDLLGDAVQADVVATLRLAVAAALE